MSAPRAIVALRRMTEATRRACYLWQVDGGNDRWSETLGDNHLSAIEYHCREIEKILDRLDRNWE